MFHTLIRPAILPLLLLAFTSSLVKAQEVPVINRIKTNEKVIALTFDDGPDAPMQDLLKLFEAEDCRVTFFILGEKLDKNPMLVIQASEAGHEIGNHTYTHPKLPTLEPQEIKAEILKTQQAIEKHIGTKPTLFRAPYLQHNDAVKTVLAEEKLSIINANIDVRDWDSATTSDMILQRVTENATPGSIVLMHSWSKKTLDALPEVIRTLKEEGYRFVTVSELRSTETN